MKRPSGGVLCAPRVAAAFAAVAGLALACVRRWANATDPSDEPLALPPVRRWTLERPDGVRLAVAEAGEGGRPTIVLAHCWTGDMRVWAPVARRLVERGAHVVLYDHRGHGRSTLDVEDMSLETLGDDLAALLDALPTERVVLAGHSMGGMAAQSLLRRHPDLAERKVGALAFVATACDRLRPGGPAAAWNLWLMRSPLTRVALRLPLLAPLFVRFTVGRHVRLSHLRAVIETFVATPAPACEGFLRHIYAMDHSAVLRTVTVPTAIVSGTRDLVTLHRRSRRMAELMPHARFVVIPGAGHVLPWEEPDLLTGILLELGFECGADAVPVLEQA